jgi:hypothetical protein
MTVRNFYSVLIAILVLGIPAVASADWQSKVITQCTQLVYDYAYYRDRWDAENYSQLFMENGYLVFPDGKTFKGRETLRKRVLEESGTEISHHHMTSIKILPVDEKSATGVSYLYILQAPSDAEVGALGVPAPSMVASAEYHDDYILDGQRCRFASRKIKFVFDLSH